jgi:hypothetical protein
VPTVFRASKTVALTVVQTAALTVVQKAADAQAWGSAPTGVAIRALTSARRIEARTKAPILVRIWARAQIQISVRTSEPDPARIGERTVAPDLARTAAPTAERSEMVERTVGLTAEQTVVPAVPMAEPTVVPTAGPTVAQATMLSALIAAVNTTAMWSVALEGSRARRVDQTTRRLWREPAEPAEWLMAGQMAAPTVELMAAQRPAMGPTAKRPIQTPIATIFSGGLIRIDRAS